MAAGIETIKATVFDFLERNAAQIALLSDNIFYFGELGMQEYESAALMSGLLEDGGFTVERGISGFETGFVATAGSGGPVIALHCEYDANPNNSQCSGVLDQEAIVAGAPGHCEGHNVNAAVMVAAALAVRRAMADEGVPGTLKVFGAPAEEIAMSRPYYVRDGYFDDVDIAFHDHIWGEFSTEYGLIQIACVSAEFTFHGETAHAGLTPWRGRDALDGVVLMDMGMAQYREHMEPMMRAHRVITHGGDQPNVIPERASVWWYFRDPQAAGARRLFEQAKKIAEGAALMTNTTYEVNVKSAVWPVRGNRTVAEVIQGNIERIGMPGWTADEQAFARALQEKAEVGVEGLRTDVTPLTGPSKTMAASNDCGDVSWKVPMGRLWFPANVANINFHHWTGGAALTSGVAHKGALAGAKALAGSVLDFLASPALVAEAKSTFTEEIGDTVYESLLPADQRPDQEINRAAMETYRERMRAHYLDKRPEFI